MKGFDGAYPQVLSSRLSGQTERNHEVPRAVPDPDSKCAPPKYVPEARHTLRNYFFNDTVLSRDCMCGNIHDTFKQLQQMWKDSVVD